MDNIFKTVCSNCGSEDVLTMKWVNPNTNEVSSMDAGTEGLCDYCENCKDTTSLVDKEDYNLLK